MNALSQTFHDSLDLRPVSRRPTTLSDETIRAVLARPVPKVEVLPGAGISNDLTSVIVATCNNLAFTRICLESMLLNTADTPYELVVVDNGSTDGSVEYLRDLSYLNPQVRVIFNQQNRGFSGANNQGLEAARGTRLVLLNNDTIVPPSCLSRLVAHLEDPGTGIACPATNRSGNETEIAAGYETYGALLRFAESRYRSHRGETSDISSLVMFCAAMRRNVWNEVGPLDERFEFGMFEDDDYAMRLRSAGYQIVCAEDAFIHHFGQATIGKLSPTGEYGPRFHTNRERWEKKWARSWEPHHRRRNPDYEALVRRIRREVCSTIPAGAALAVVSNGDDGLVKLGTCHVVHFPCDSNGAWTGYHPRDSREAIADLETIRGLGVEYLVVPSTASWWLEHYADFHRHLERTYQLLAHDSETCAVFELSPADVTSNSREERPIA